MKQLLVLLTLLVSLLATDVLACQKYGSNVQDDAGNIIPSAFVTVTIFNSATVATIYSDSNCASIAPNPIQVNSDGSYVFYAQDGHYSLSFVASGYALAPVLDVAIFEPFGANIKASSEFPVQSDICSTGQGAIDSTGATVRTLYLNQPSACTTNKTIPSTLSIVCLGLGSVTVSGGVTLTVNGSVKNLTDHPCFIGTGTTTFGATSRGDAFNVDGTTPLTYSASMTADRRLGKTQIVAITNNTNFTMNAPLPASVPVGTEICFDMQNHSGGSLSSTITWNAVFKVGTWTHAANNNRRTACFRWDGTLYVESTLTSIDVPF